MLNYFSGSGCADSGQVVSFEVNYHIEFCLLFCAVKKLVEISSIHRGLANSRTSTFNWLGGDDAVGNRYEHLRWGTYDMKIAGVDISCVVAWIIMVLPVEKVYRPGLVIAFKSLWKVDLVNVAVINIAPDFFDCPQIIILIHIASDLRKIDIIELGRCWACDSNILWFVK